MNQQNKKGFSLIEVMLLFVVLAIILSASVPVVTRKSKPVPNKIGHGVYRCIYTPNGLIEELYTGTRRVKPEQGAAHEFVEACHFTVPKAVLYRVDLYSAGAGGTLAGVMSSNQDDTRSADYNSDTTYSNFSSEHEEGVLSDDESILLRKLSNSEIKYMLDGETLIRNTYTGDAGRGGKAAFKWYPTPTYASCNGQSLVLSAARRAYEAEAAKSDKNSSGYAFTGLETEIGRLDGEATTWGNLATNSESNKVTYDGLTDALTQINSIIGWLSSLSSSDVYGHLKDGSKQSLHMGNGVNKSLTSEFGVLENNLSANAADKAISAATTARDDAYDNYVENIYPAEIAAAVAEKRAAAIAAAEAAAEAAAAGQTADEIAAAKQTAANNAANNFNTAQAETEAKAENPLKQKGTKGDVDYMTEHYLPSSFKASYHSGDRNGLVAYIKTDNTACFNELKAGSYQTELNNISVQANTIKTEIETAKKVYDDILTKYNTDDFDKLKDIAKDKEREAKDAKNDKEIDLQNAIEAQEAKAKQLKDVHDSIKDSSVKDILEANGFTKENLSDREGNTKKQIEYFCKQAFDIHDPNVSQKGVTFKDTNKEQDGARGGQGKYLILEFPIRMDDKAGNPEQYLRDIQTPGNTKAYRTVRCKDVSGALGSNCYSDKPSPDLSGTPKTADYNKDYNNSDIFEYSYPERHFKTTDGKDLSTATYPYIGWAVPYYTDGQVTGAGYITLTKTLPTGGERGKMYVDETKQGTYTEQAIDNPLEKTAEEIGAIVFDKNYAYTIKTNTSAVGSDTEFYNASYDNVYSYKMYNDQDVYAKVYAAALKDTTQAHPSYKDVKIHISSALWTKNYQVGKSGTSGKFATFLSAGLGSTCDFHVPEGGPVLDLYGDHEDIADLEDALAASITCVNKDGQLIFEKTLPGGKYNTTLETPENNKFIWYQGVGEKVVSASNPAIKTWHPTSIWAKVYTNFMGGYDNYDLNQYRVGAAGQGTTLTDKCIEPKGFYTLQKQYYIKYGSTSSEHTIDVGDVSSPTEFLGIRDDGVECYGHPANEDDEFVADYILTNDTPDAFVMEAQEGGGGAVVITW